MFQNKSINHSPELFSLPKQYEALFLLCTALQTRINLEYFMSPS